MGEIRNFLEKERYKKFLKSKGLLPGKKKKGERTFADTFITRGSKLKTSYRQYLKSARWRALKTKAKKKRRFRKCLFCESRKIELHHTTYKWIYTKKELQSIIPVCRNHHQEIHDLSLKNNISVKLASEAIIRKYKKR